MAEIDVSLQMACYLGLGFMARKRNLVDHTSMNGFSRLVFNISLPFVVLNAMRNPITPEQMAGIPWALLAVGVYLAVTVLLGFVCARGHDGYAQSMRVCILISNFTYMGFPVVEALYGAQGLFYLSLISIPMRVVVYGGTPLLFADKSHGGLGRLIGHSLISPPMLMVPIGLALSAFQPPMPGWLDAVIRTMAGTGTPLGLLLCGMFIAEVPVGQIFADKRVPLTVLVRTVIAPACVLGALWLLPIPEMVRNVAVIVAALPCGSILSVYAANYNKAPSMTALTIMATTLLSIATIPAWAWVLGRL